LANGVSMGVVVKTPLVCSAEQSLSDTERYDTQRHPVAIETPPIHQAILGLLVPWHSGMAFKLGALGWKNFGAFIGISRDHCDAKNRVEIDSEGNPVIHYRILNKDVPNLLAGLETILRLLRASGGKALFYTHSSAPWFVGHDDDDDDFEAYIANIKSVGIKPLEMQIFSAHQMSSCRMASDPKVGPVSPSGELFGCSNLFVADGSVLPTSLGINPMITIDAIAHMIAQNILTKLATMS
jgi:choline dehydrogenase-like flavoprotein